MKLYTKTGDDGSTGLFGGQRVGKDEARVEAYGTVDEANAALGCAHAVCSDPTLRTDLEALMGRLFDLGADLATPGSADRRIGQTACDDLERLIDRTEVGNTPLKTFILPGGCELAARLHLARAIVRRAERRVVPLVRRGEVEPAGLVYLNRLGDLLFALARRANRQAGVEDVPWQSNAETAD
jgi:cob(I)alamin adenosyltransferase